MRFIHHILSLFYSFSMVSLQLFDPGQVYYSAGVYSECVASDHFFLFMLHCLHRHCLGDWGELDPEDAALNQHALRQGGRLFSAYSLPQELSSADSRIWIITEADRVSTTALFPGEY
jgi:hypothetical protein